MSISTDLSTNNISIRTENNPFPQQRSSINTKEKLNAFFNKCYLIEFYHNQSPPLLRIYEDKSWYQISQGSCILMFPIPINDLMFSFVGTKSFKKNKEGEAKLKLTKERMIIDEKLLNSKTIQEVLSLEPKEFQLEIKKFSPS